MLKSAQLSDAPLSDQVAFWNKWNAEAREHTREQVSLDQADAIVAWMNRLGRTDLDIIDVGCGTGWMCADLIRYGRVTGTDLSDEVLARASQRVPEARFVAGDFANLDFGTDAFDVVVSLEVLSHVADQRAFMAKIARHLREDGYLMLATQNRPQLERNDIPPPKPGQIRQWVDRHQLTELLSEHFVVEEMFSLTPKFNRGLLRRLNSPKLDAMLAQAGLGAVSQAMKRGQERAWLGWTLMTLARKKRT